MERRGIATERGAVNREIVISNQEIRQTKARINRLKNWLKAEAKTTTPTLADVLSEILQGDGDRNHYQKIHDLKTAAKTLVFIQENNISSLPELQEKVSEFHGRLSDLRDRLKPIERRLKTLDEHIKQSEIHAKYKGIYKKYSEQKPKDRERFYEAHRAELSIYEAASRYLKNHLNGRTQIPLKDWKSERAKLTAEMSVLDGKYKLLKEEIHEVEIIRRYAESVERSIAPPQKSHSHEMGI
jgi:chromosome segregation ATPase